jgi:uncharacterized protein involved in outer membrane biogenesis
MMIKKIVKYSLSILALLVIVLLAAPFFLDVDDYKKSIEQQVEDATGRTLHIGTLQASLFPWVGVTLDDVELANRQGFADKPFLKVKHLDIQVALLPLLSQELEIKRFKLNEPEVFLEKNAKGESNWEDLLPSTAQAVDNNASKVASPNAEASQQSSPLLAALSAESLDLKDGKFVWSDAQAGTHITLSDVQVELDDVQLQRPVHAHVSARINGDKVDLTAHIGPLGDLSSIDTAHLPIQLTLKSDAIHLKSFAKTLGAFPEVLGDVHQASVKLDVQLEQRPDGVRSLAGDMDLLAALNIGLDWKLEMPNTKSMHIQHANIAVNDTQVLHMQGDVKGLTTTPKYQLRIQSEKLQRTWLADFIPALASMYAAHPAPWNDVKLGASLAGTTKRLDIRDMQLLLNGEMIQLSGTANFAKAPDIRLRVAANTLHMDPWLPKPETTKPASQDTGDAADNAGVEQTQNKSAVEPDLRFLKPWRVSLQLQIEQLLMHNLVMEHLRGSLNGEKGLFKLNPLRFDLAGGQVRETATLNAARYPATWTESIHISGLTLKPVLKAVADTDLLDGTMQLDTNLKATGLLPETSMASLNGTGQILLQDGRMKGFDIAGTLRNLTSLGTASNENKYTDFAQLQASFTIHNGIAKNDDLFMASPLFRLTGKGIVNLPASTLDYHVRPKLIGSLIGQGDTLTVRKGLSVPLHISGPMASPKVRPEVDAKSLIENVGGVLGSGGSKVGGVLGQILGGAKKKPAANSASPSQPSQPAQPSPPATPKKKVQKAIQGLLGF